MGPNDPNRPAAPPPPVPGGPPPPPPGRPIQQPLDGRPHEEIMQILREIKEMLVRIETKLGR